MKMTELLPLKVYLKRDHTNKEIFASSYTASLKGKSLEA